MTTDTQKSDREVGEFIEGQWWDARLQCCVRSLEYNFETRMGRVWLPHGKYNDMNGCIRVFTAIHPAVKQIVVKDDGGRTITYRKWSSRGRPTWRVA